MFTKPMTLTDFINAEFKKYYIEKNSNNLKAFRNKVNYLLGHDPLLKKEKAKTKPLTSKKDARKKAFPASLWNKVDQNESFQLYALQHRDPKYLKILEQADRELYGDPNLMTKVEREKKEGLDHIESLTLEDKNHFLLKAIFKALYPDKIIDWEALEYDLSRVDLKNNPNVSQEAYFAALYRQLDPRNYLKKED